MNLRTHILSGIRWTAAENVANALSGLVSMAVLARLLQPQDFGLMAIVMVVLAFCQVFADLGVSNAIIHHQDIREAELSTLYWANVLGGVAVFALVLLASVPLAHFYREPRLAPLIMVAGTGIVVQAAGQQFAVLLRKELQFDLLARIGILGRFAGLVVAVTLAACGFGVWALVCATLATTAVTSAMYAAAGWQLHQPRLEFHPGRVRSHFGFGAYQVGEGSVNYLNSNLDSLLIGRLLGSEALGLYTVAKQFVMYPAQMVSPIVARVAVPVMARVQDDLPRLRALYLQAINHLSSLTFPVYAAIAVFAPEITALVLGPQWLAGAPVVRILAVYAAVRSIGSPVGSLVLARGRVRLAFWWNVGLVLLLPLALLAGAQGGTTGVAWALLAMQLVLLAPAWKVLVQPLCGAGFREYHLQILRPAIPTLVGALAGYLAADLVSGQLPRLVAGSLAGTLVTLAVYRAFNREFLEALRAMLLLHRP